MWRVKDVVVSNGIIECHIEKLKIEMGSWTPNCLRHHIWLDVSTLNKRLFTTKQRWFMLILICEASQIFVWRNKAFIFFQKSDIIVVDRQRLSHSNHPSHVYGGDNVGVSDCSCQRHCGPTITIFPVFQGGTSTPTTKESTPRLDNHCNSGGCPRRWGGCSNSESSKPCRLKTMLQELVMHSRAIAHHQELRCCSLAKIPMTLLKVVKEDHYIFNSCPEVLRSLP